MAMYRKKPVVIEAHQWFKNGDHPLDYVTDHQDALNPDFLITAAFRRSKNWEGDVVRYYRHPDVPGDSLCEQCGKTHHEHGWIDTLEQGHRVCPGDWIITGVKGERYPCKPDIFAATYDPADAILAPSAWQPIETAPKDGTRVSLCSHSGNVASGYWEHYTTSWWDWPFSFEEPTRWMPLPAPPGETN